MTHPGIRAVERLAAQQAKRLAARQAPVCCDNCGKAIAGTDAGVVVPGLGGKPLGLACRDCESARVTLAGGPGIVLPHDSLCCAQGRDERADDGRTYVVHGTGARWWGWTVLPDGSIVDRWRSPP